MALIILLVSNTNNSELYGFVCDFSHTVDHILIEKLEHRSEVTLEVFYSAVAATRLILLRHL